MVRPRVAGAVAALTALGGALALPANSSQAASPRSVSHIFVINLENKGYEETFGESSPAPYLSRELRAQGQLLSQYYGTAHNSLPNYIAQISGQEPSKQTQGDCQVYSDFMAAGTAAPQQAVGDGCVYPSTVQTVAGQLQATGRTWRGYMEDMGTPCRHPQLNTPDDTHNAQPGDQYAARHNPFGYFHSIIDSPTCAANDVDLSRLTTDLQTVSTTPNLGYVTPNLCNDGHDSPCVDGRPGGLATADEWLRTWVPRIMASPAYQRDGLLVITFDEADSNSPDSAAACCGEGSGPNIPLPGIYGPGGGRTGALVLSPSVAPGSFNDTPYNHYSLLRSVEDTFKLPLLGYAQTVSGFGTDVFGTTR